MTAMALLSPMAVPAHAHTHAWTSHSAAALLDASFPTRPACEHALEDARRRERSGSEQVHGLDYTRLFEQAGCSSYPADAGLAWRIRMHWTRRS